MKGDRRRFHRWDADIACTCRTEHLCWPARIVDFSYGGARIVQSSIFPPEGEEVEIIFHTGNDQTVRARVVYAIPLQREKTAFGAAFYGDIEEKRLKLLPVFRKLVEGKTTIPHA